MGRLERAVAPTLGDGSDRMEEVASTRPFCIIGPGGPRSLAFALAPRLSNEALFPPHVAAGSSR
eukprot:scaffold66724_cov31-Tisochrysis_lutea.AAC.1